MCDFNRTMLITKRGHGVEDSQLLTNARAEEHVRHTDRHAEEAALARRDRALAGEGGAPAGHATLEHDDNYPHEIVEQMKELGLFGATIGPEYGGLGLSASTYAQDRHAGSPRSGWRSPGSSTRT